MWFAYLAALVIVLVFIVRINRRDTATPFGGVKIECVPIEWWSFAVKRAKYFKRALESAVFQARQQARRAEYAEGLLNSLFEPPPEHEIIVHCAMGLHDRLRVYTTQDDQTVLVIEEDHLESAITLSDDDRRRLAAYLIPYVADPRSTRKGKDAV